MASTGGSGTETLGQRAAAPTDKPVIHPNWLRAPNGVTEGYSLEVTAKDIEALREAAPLIPPETPIAVTFLPGEELEGRIATARTVRSLGFEPMPHFSARRFLSHEEFSVYLKKVVAEADVRRCFVIAGDPSESAGPFHDSSAMIATGEFERAGIKAIGIGGHPDGHPNMTIDECWEVLDRKRLDIESRGMAPLIVTQFGFNPQVFLDWLDALRTRGIDSPVRIGVPGPAGIATLIRFAARCGVAASSSVMSKYGVSLTKLMGTAGPDKLVDALAEHLQPRHGPVRLHFYPFGGLKKTVSWIAEYARSHDKA